MRPAPTDGSGTVIRAAGAVLWRPSRRYGVRVALVHRPRYDDWSLPKGKAEIGEVPHVTAAREVHEETGLTVTVGDVLAVSEYLDPDGEHKSECFFAATLTDPPAVLAPWQDTGGPVCSFGLFTESELSSMDVRPGFLATTRPDQPSRPTPVYIAATP